MKKLILLMTALMLVACAEHEPDTITWEETEVTFVPTSRVVYPTPKPVAENTTQKAFIIDHSYMAEQVQKLQQAASTTGIQIKQLQNKILIVLPHQVAFGSNQATLDTQFEPILSAMARTMKEYDATKIRIVGYTDNADSVVANKALSLRRANAVSNFLRLNGVDINRIVVDGLGPENPLTSNNTAKGREKNNRVEITLENMQ